MYLWKTITDYTPASVSNVASAVASRASDISKYVLGYEQVPDQTEIDSRMDPQAAFDAAEKLGVWDFIRIKKYYSIVFASQNSEHSKLAFQARCRLALLIAQYPMDEISSELDDKHGLLLGKAKEVNKLLLDIYEGTRQQASYLSWKIAESIDMLMLSMSALYDLIEKGTKGFVADHQNYPFDRFVEVNARWKNWDMIFRTYQLTSQWFEQNFKNANNNKIKKLELPVISIEEIYSAVYINEVIRLRTQYHGKAMTAYQVHTSLTKIESKQPKVNEQKAKAAYQSLRCEVAQAIALSDYQLFLTKSIEERQSPGARIELLSIQQYLVEANAITALSGESLKMRQAIEVLLEDLDSEYAKSHTQLYVNNTSEALNGLLSEDCPDKILLQIAWLHNRKNVLEECQKRPASDYMKEGESVPVFNARIDALLKSIVNLSILVDKKIAEKEKEFSDALPVSAIGKAESAIILSLELKKQSIKIVGSTFLKQDPKDAVFADQERDHLRECLIKLLSDSNTMRAFYSGAKEEQNQREIQLKTYLSGLFSHSAYSNTITLNKHALEEASINRMKAICAGPEAVLKKKAEF